MKASEHKTVCECIDMLMGPDGDFTTAIGRLCRLVGRRYAVYEALKDTESMSVIDAARGPNREFRVTATALRAHLSRNNPGPGAGCERKGGER